MESEDYMLDIMLSPGNTFARVNSTTVSRTRNMKVIVLIMNTNSWKIKNN